MKVSLYPDTPAEYFRTWFGAYCRELPLTVVRPARMRKVPDAERADVVHFVPISRGPAFHEVYLLSSGIAKAGTLEVVSLTPQRTEVRIEYRSYVAPYIDQLANAIEERWPGAKRPLQTQKATASPPTEQPRPEAGAGDGARPPGQRSRRMPDYERHKAIWDAIAPRWANTHSYARCRSLLQDRHAHLLRKGKNGQPTISDKTLRTIIEEGAEGLLTEARH